MKEQTTQLSIEKELITSDFMEAEKSFSDEISLRLLF
jgi:predicted transposase YbfD/YdcC